MSQATTNKSQIKTGNQFGRLTTRQPTRDKDRRHAWLCDCECGGTCVVSDRQLRDGKKCCGCRGIKIGDPFGELTVTKRLGGTWWLCDCDCGGTCVVSGGQLRKGDKKSCGCLKVKENLPSAKVMKQRHADGQEIRDGDKTWVILAYAAKFLNVSRKRIPRWAIQCWWLDGRGIETLPFADGMGRTVTYYLKVDRDRKRRNKAASLEVIKQAMKNFPIVPNVPAYKYLPDAADELGIDVDCLRMRLKRKFPSAKIKRVFGRSPYGRATPRAFLPNWAFVKLGGQIDAQGVSETTLGNHTDRILGAVKKEGRKTRITTKKVGAMVGAKVEKAGEDMHAGPAPKSERLTVNVECLTATLDGETFDVKSAMAVRWLKVLSDRPGEWLSAEDLKRFDTELDGARPDRLKRFIPAPVLKLIDSETGKGSRLHLA